LTELLAIDPSPSYLVAAPGFPNSHVEGLDISTDADHQARFAGKASTTAYRTVQELHAAKKIFARADRHPNFEFHHLFKFIGNELPR